MTDFYQSDHYTHITVTVWKFRIDTSGNENTKWNQVLLIRKQRRMGPCLQVLKN